MAEPPVLQSRNSEATSSVDGRSIQPEQPEIGAYCASPFGIMVMLQILVSLDTVMHRASQFFRGLRGPE